MKKLLSLVFFLRFALLSAQAAASPAECAAAYEEGQRLMATAQLLQSARQFRYCGSPACPEVMHGECLRFLDRVEAMTPSVVVRLESEQPVSAQISVDEQPEVPLDGRAISLDPGDHRLRLSAAGYAVAERSFRVAEGESLKVVEVRLVPLAKRGPVSIAVAQPSSQAKPPTVVPWIVTGTVAGIGAAGLTYWGLRARSGETTLDSCRPDCTQGQVDNIRRDYLLANVSVGVGVGGLVAMAVWYALTPSSSVSRKPPVSLVGPAPAASALSVGWTLRL